MNQQLLEIHSLRNSPLKANWLTYLTIIVRLADVLDINLEHAIVNKMEKNKPKYPATAPMNPRSKRV
jgi:hypothetical protein